MNYASDKFAIDLGDLHRSSFFLTFAQKMHWLESLNHRPSFNSIIASWDTVMDQYASRLGSYSATEALIVLQKLHPKVFDEDRASHIIKNWDFSDLENVDEAWE